MSEPSGPVGPRARPPQRVEISPRPFIGMAGLACAFFLYAASGVFAPWWAVGVLLLAWAAMLVVGLAWWTPHPNRLPWLAVAAVVVWFPAVVLLSLL